MSGDINTGHDLIHLWRRRRRRKGKGGKNAV